MEHPAEDNSLEFRQRFLKPHGQGWVALPSGLVVTACLAGLAALLTMTTIAAVRRRVRRTSCARALMARSNDRYRRIASSDSNIE